MHQLCAEYSAKAEEPADAVTETATQPPQAEPATRPALPARQWSTPLAKTIAQAIEVRPSAPLYT